MGLTEKMVENLFPTVKQPNTFLKELEHDVETSSGLQIQLTQQRSSETWPAVFSLPAFPQQIHEALQRKDPSLKKKGKSRLRSLLIQVLFDNITKHTWYPNHTIYADVLGSLITKFPFLKDCSASGHDTLLQCLRNKFKKERISLVRSSTIQELGVKRNLMDHTSSDGLGFEEEHAKRRKTTHPIYTQENLENMGEDETSFQEHISAINTELRRGQPDYTEIKNHMRQTLFKRLELMEKPTKEVMDMFPFLGVPQLVLHEIKIRFGMDLHINLENALQALAPKILRVARSGCQSELLTNLLLNIDPSTKDLEKNAALLILPSLFQENAKFLFCQENESARPTPTIIFHGASNPLDAKRASIRMDGVTIITDDMGMTEALECLFAVYFIFSVEYPKPITHTMNFIEHYLFKLYSGHKKIVYTSS